MADSRWHTVLTVWRKEVLDALRDKRSLRLAFLMPVYFILAFAGSSLFAIHMGQSGTGGDTRLAVAGAEHLPQLMNWLREQGVELDESREDIYAAVENREIEYGLIVPEAAAAEYAGFRSATLWLVYDAANPSVHGSLHFVRQQINAWSRQEASLRILARGVSPELVQPVVLRESNVASDRRMAGFLLGAVPMFILMSAFIGSVGFSADMTAGERERRSLESLLITPASSPALMLGKWLTCVLLTLLVVGLLLVGLGLCMALIPFNQLGLRVDVGWGQHLGIVAITLPIVLMAVSLQLLVAIFARSFKDAQTYIGLMTLLPLVPFFFTMFSPGVPADWFYWVPVLAQQVGIRELLLGGELPSLALLQVWLTAAPLAVLAWLLAAAQLRRGKIVYG